MSHTPGPWSIFGTTKDGDIEIFTGDRNWHVALAISDCGNEDSQEETKANARLIAAAPDLLEALKLLPLDAFDKDMGEIDAAEFVDNAGAFYEAMVAARAAIANALLPQTDTEGPPQPARGKGSEQREAD